MGIVITQCLSCLFYSSASAKNPSWSLEGSVLFDNSIAQYTGGEVKVEKSFDLSLSVVPMPELVHVSIGMESVKFTVRSAIICKYAIQSMLLRIKLFFRYWNLPWDRGDS